METKFLFYLHCEACMFLLVKSAQVSGMLTFGSTWKKEFLLELQLAFFNCVNELRILLLKKLFMEKC